MDGGAGVQEMMEYEVDMCVCVCALKGFHDKTHREVDFFFQLFSMWLEKINTSDSGGFRKYHALDFVSKTEKTHDQ